MSKTISIPRDRDMEGTTDRESCG